MARAKIITVYTRVLKLLKPVAGVAIALTLANLALATAPFLQPILFGQAVDLLAQAPARGAEATWHDGTRIFGLWALVGVGSIVAGMIVSLHADRLAHRLRLRVMADYFEHVLGLHLAFHTDSHSSRLLKILHRGTEHLFNLWLSMFRSHLSTLVSLLVLLPLTLFLNWQLAMVLIVLVVLYATLTTVVTRRTNKAQGEVESYHSALAEQAGDTIGNVVLVQSFVRQDEEIRRMRAMMDKLLQVQFPVLNWWAVVTVLNGAAATLSVISIFALGAWLNLQGKATVGEIVTFMGFANHLIGKLDAVIGFVNRLFHQAHGLSEFFEILDTPSEVSDRADARPLTAVQGAVRFEQVSFAYHNGKQALKAINLDAAAGQTIALVGETGAGKTTAMSLLHRQRDPQQGRILLDGVDIREYQLDSLRSQIGVVFQENMLFFRTIAENLRIGKPDASDEELIAAARRAQAHEFIMAQPHGYQTRIGERGSNLSGGERQRLAIARVLLKNPPLLILDEATSALDAGTEIRVQQALQTLMENRTTFVIAHRLSTIRNADQILVFRQGEIIERGSFHELNRQQGYFHELAKGQFGAADAVSAGIAG